MKDSAKKESNEAAADTVLANGVRTLKFPDGKTKAEIPMKDGKRHGLAKEYYTNGNVFQEVNYVNGVKEGIARQYYEHGVLAQETPFKADKRHGVQLKYRSNGKPSAEVKYNNDELCKGLVEYLLNGDKKKKFPTIVVKPVNTLLKDNQYTLHLSMSDNSNVVEFYVGDLTPEGCVSPYDLERIPATGPGKAAMVFNAVQGEFLMKTVNIVAKVKTPQGNYYITERPYNVSIEFR